MEGRARRVCWRILYRFLFSVKRNKIINQLHGEFVSFNSEIGINYAVVFSGPAGPVNRAVTLVKSSGEPMLINWSSATRVMSGSGL